MTPSAAAALVALLGVGACRGGGVANPNSPEESASNAPTASSAAAEPDPAGSSIARPTTESPLCALDPQGWCRAPQGDPCGQHDDVASCRADAACGGIPYRGESVIACRLDERDFGINCPTVGCRTLARPVSEPAR